ncbi:hypothetical protein [Agromyces sp. SYSU T00194]|uniref:hypothetical protein n=1 Tax=Agromyces chitinivorans TaxID=3158560 RepID=UPI0033984F6D
MRTIDTLDGTFPHATPEGYERGCRGSCCPGIEDVGWSCSYAIQQYRGDFQWRRWVDDGMTPEQIRDARQRQEAAAAAKAAKRGPAPVASQPTITVADSHEPVRERPKPRPVRNPAATVRPVTPPRSETHMTSQDAPTGFEKFVRGSRGSRTLTMLSARAGKGGKIAVSTGLHRKLGDHVQLMFNPSSRRIALRSVDGADPDAYPISSKSHTISASAFMRHYEISPGTRWALAEETDAAGVYFASTVVEDES